MTNTSLIQLKKTIKKILKQDIKTTRKITLLSKLGFENISGKAGHFKLSYVTPKHKIIFTLPSTPSDSHSFENAANLIAREIWRDF